MTTPTEKQLHSAMAKLVLSIAQQGRDIKGALCMSWMLKLVSVEGSEGKDQLRPNSAACLAKGNGHNLSPPAIYLFGGLLKGLLSRGVAIGQATAAIIKEASEKWSEMNVEECRNFTHYCRLCKVYDPELTRLEFITTDIKLRDSINKALSEVEGKRLLGAAPPGGLEDILQKYLDSK